MQRPTEHTERLLLRDFTVVMLRRAIAETRRHLRYDC